MGFKQAQARPLPRLACIGRVSAVPEAKVSQSEVYVVQRIEITGYGPSRNIRPMFLYRPDWLTEGFDPESLKELENGESMLGVYRNHVGEKDEISVLLGLCGCKDEVYDALGDKLFALGIDPAKIESDDDMRAVMDAVTNVLKEFLIDEKNGNEIGYILRQQYEKTGEVDENGRPVRVPTKYYEVAEYFDPNDEKKIASLKKSAEKSDGKFKITFDDTPF